MSPRKTRFQRLTKLIAGRCTICPEARYPCLQVHRIIPGEEGGKYTPGNCVTLCANCHALVTAGVYRTLAIRQHSAHPSGVLHWADAQGEAHFSPLPVDGVLPQS